MNITDRYVLISRVDSGIYTDIKDVSMDIRYPFGYPNMYLFGISSTGGQKISEISTNIHRYLNIFFDILYIRIDQYGPSSQMVTAAAAAADSYSARYSNRNDYSDDLSESWPR